MSYRKKNILGAAALALVAVVFMVAYISKAHSGNAHKTKKQVVARASVLIARHDIRAGTPGNSLQHGAFASRIVPAGAVPPDAVTSAASVRGLVVRRKIVAGRPVSLTRFGPAAASGVRVQLRGKERVVQLDGDPSQVLDGTLRRGDHVDVLATWNDPESCSSCHVSRVIVRNALVLATSADLGTHKSLSSQTIPVQLRLTDGEARRVFWMDKNGAWWLELRPVVHPGNSPQGFDTATTILAHGMKVTK
jgi:Flp pilus assembly protein CpaB